MVAVATLSPGTDWPVAPVGVAVSWIAACASPPELSTPVIVYVATALTGRSTVSLGRPVPEVALQVPVQVQLRFDIVEFGVFALICVADDSLGPVLVTVKVSVIVAPRAALAVEELTRVADVDRLGDVVRRGCRGSRSSRRWRRRSPSCR